MRATRGTHVCSCCEQSTSRPADACGRSSRVAQSQRPSTSSQVSSALPCMPVSASAALGQHAATSCDCDSQDTRAIVVWVASGRHYVAKQRVVADGRLLPVWLQCAANVLVSTSTAELAQDIHVCARTCVQSMPAPTTHAGRSHANHPAPRRVSCVPCWRQQWRACRPRRSKPP